MILTDGNYQKSDFSKLCTHPQQRGSIRFHEILTELGQLHDKKQADYGRPDDPFANVRAGTEWGVPAWVGSMMRAGDKFRRLQAYVRNGRLANEGVKDSLYDIAVYTVISIVLFEEIEHGEKQTRGENP